MQHIGLTSLLLDHGADVNLTHGHDGDPLRSAYDSRNILKHGTNVNMRKCNPFGTLLHDASIAG